jgi:microcystin-dependent protein
MPTGIQNWSKTAASNGNTDSSVNWLEGQAPSTVNDSARAMMARLKEWHDDLGGITTGGTSTAYTLTSNRVFTSLALMDGSVIVIKPHTDNGAAPTLNVDSLGAKQITLSPGVNITAGFLKANSFYALIYVNAASEFRVLSSASGSKAIGEITDYAGTTAPALHLMCFGQAVSRSTYAALFAVTSTTFGAGDGSTTFNLPDCRGRVVAGKDDMGGASANRLTNLSGGLDGDVLGATGGAESNTLAEANLPSHTHSFSATTDSQGAHTHLLIVDATSTSWPALNSGNSVIRWSGFGTGAGNEAQLAGNASTPDIGLSASGGTHTHSVSGTSGTGSGSGTAHNNVQPTIVFNKIIFAGV